MNRKQAQALIEKKVNLLGELAFSSIEVYFRVPKGAGKDEIDELISMVQNKQLNNVTFYPEGHEVIVEVKL